MNNIFHDIVERCCARFETGQTFSYVQTDATTPYIVGPTMLGVAASVARSLRPVPYFPDFPDFLFVHGLTGSVCSLCVTIRIQNIQAIYKEIEKLTIRELFLRLSTDAMPQFLQIITSSFRPHVH